ncbi:hypothetical protein IF188_05600 [Microbacterium sp. NEAU-LLC]|uniref:Uncharacterized protein n=1 Tax=Microbacterium helvum TaxID=2773713 RepID=A0ABR8NKG9_9MICO|nr:hypothetical protein [Microbacterium helvum]MBD3941172.1 hypothetical protein [Microbacterium helvum]
MNGLERIRRFSLVTWIFGSIVVAVIAFIVFPQVAVNPRTGEIEVGGDAYNDGPRPWEVADPQEYTVVDGELHGTRAGGFLRLPAGSPLIQLTGGSDVEQADWVDVYQQLGTQTDTEAGDWDYPGYLGALYPDAEVLVLASTDADGLLWFGQSEADWTVKVTEPEVTPMDTTSASGTGNAVLMYEGDALSGRFQHTGTGVFLVGAVTVGDWERLVNEVDEVDERVSWDPTDRVVFQVEADTGDGSWTITLDTPAGTASEPSATPTGDPPTHATPEPTP